MQLKKIRQIMVDVKINSEPLVLTTEKSGINHLFQIRVFHIAHSVVMGSLMTQ